ncbi:MAG: hypothetical protein ACLSVD_00770 [Eggerthellaceae bacterium]
MQVFKTAIKTVLRHPMYLIVYAGFLSMMGVFIASGLTFGGTNDSEFSPYETKFAVIDRDGSALSDGLAAYLGSRASKFPSKTARWRCKDAVARVRARTSSSFRKGSATRSWKPRAPATSCRRSRRCTASTPPRAA